MSAPEERTLNCSHSSRATSSHTPDSDPQDLVPLDAVPLRSTPKFPPGACRAYPNVSATVEVHAPKYCTTTGQTADKKTTQTTAGISVCVKIVKRIRNLFAQQPIGHTLLHRAGLKPFSFKKRYKGANGEEIPKPVVVKSRVLALTSLVIHLLPTCITILLVSMNASVFVNGPPITTLAKYALQGSSKLHELTIVGSLTRVITDGLRYQLIHDGVSFGMLSSPFSFLGLNYLWSQEVFSAAKSSVRLRSKAHKFLLGVLLVFCFLAAIVGPASALLFLPSPAWLSAGSTEIFLIGTEDQLWPQELTQNHTGPDRCKGGNGGDFFCLQGGWNIVKGFVTPEGISRRTVNVVDGWTARMMWLWRPSRTVLGTDSWASTLHGATAYFADRMRIHHDYAWSFAKGRQRRLRDATVSGIYSRVTGRIPVVRVLCAPFKLINKTSPTLLFPVLDADRPWRFDNEQGPTKELKLNGTYEALVNATWTLLPGEFGTSTAGLAFVTNNATGASVGCGCSFDARWAQGYSALHGESKYWQAFIGPPNLPEALMFADPQRLSFFEPKMKKYLGPSIKSEPNWIQQLSSGYQLMDLTGNFTALEVILVSTRLWDVPWVLTDAMTPIRELEAVLSAYFVNALSRIGWDPQRHPTREDVNPILRVGSRDNDHLLHDGGQIWQRPVNISTEALKQEWFNYATAWQLNDPALYISVVVLGIHIAIVVIHSIAVIWSKQTSEAWDSISELLALAYTSSPDGATLKNCGAGIMLQETLSQKVKVIAVEDNGNRGAHRVQLVPCESRPNARLSSPHKSMIAEVNQRYG
ncbi:hypothetical protein BKA66DRAFT_574001 [Pyrenochaeta sp. MPI-SDFR-AT-0127]|nr:hypothetical protein BKA66DRAFT_574001 [Pyrenochaeta sp. MPI-SDFR-AT-0127]